MQKEQPALKHWSPKGTSYEDRMTPIRRQANGCRNAILVTLALAAGAVAYTGSIIVGLEEVPVTNPSRSPESPKPTTSIKPEPIGLPAGVEESIPNNPCGSGCLSNYRDPQQGYNQPGCRPNGYAPTNGPNRCENGNWVPNE